MVPKIHKRGTRTLGLIYYLYGPGKAEEHIDPHLVASWDHAAPDPGRNTGTTYQMLQQLLDQPLALLTDVQRAKPHVWHLSVRNAPEDPILSDEQWGDTARRMVAAAGIDDPDQEAGCRWAAVRHADDHIHIVATLAREDGYRPDLNQDAARVQAEARLLEKELGLRRLTPGDGTAAQRPTSAERHKARRQGRERTAREELREKVRRAATGTLNEKEFFTRLAAAGLLVERRVAPSGDLLGYKVALPDDRNADGQPIYYPGSKLAPDLSLPRLHQRWASADTPDTPNSGFPEERMRSHKDPASARRSAAGIAWQAVLVLDQGDDAVIAGQIAATAEVLDALATTSAAHTRTALREAANAYERASRSHIRAVRGHDRGLRRAARDLVRGGPALGRGEHAATTAMLIDMAIFLVIAAGHWHARKGHAQQAAAARQTAEHLRAAYREAAGPTLAVLAHRGRRMPAPLRQRQRAHLRNALPELAETVLGEHGWDALAATLAEVEAAGIEPVALLSEAVGQRELASAESISDVLVWRLRRLADLPADAPAEAGTTSRTPARPAASTKRAKEHRTPKAL